MIGMFFFLLLFCLGGRSIRVSDLLLLPVGVLLGFFLFLLYVNWRPLSIPSFLRPFMSLGVTRGGSADGNRLPPVDAIYRPHIVHHTVVPPEVKAAQMRNKTKRYFAAD